MPLNRFAITSHRGVVTSLFLKVAPSPSLPAVQLTSRDAIELAAWLVVMAETNAVFYGDIADERAIAADALGELAKLVHEIESRSDGEPPPEGVFDIPAPAPPYPHE